jgi:hypothetical protein
MIEPITLLLARVGGVGAGVAALAARGVVGQRAVDPARRLVDGQPLGAVHLRAAEQVARLARLDDDLALVREADERPLAGAHRQPAPAAAGVEARDVQRAVVEQLGVGLEAAGLDPVAADELVDVLEARVLAAVDDGAAVLRHRHPGAFVRGAAERGALDRRARRVVGVDLDHPAEAVGLVGVAHGVEALVVLVPAVAPAVLADAPAALVRGGLVGAAEVAGEVLLAGEVGAPGRHARGAVVEGAERQPPGRVGRRLHHRVAGRRPADRERRVRREAPRVARRPHRLPAVALEPHLADRDAVRGLALLHLLGGPRLHAAGVQQAVVGVLVVHHEQAARRAALEREEVDAVVVHAHLHGLLGGGVAGVVLERRHVAGHADRLAPGDEGRGGVPLGHDEAVAGAWGDGLEAER